MVNGRDLHHDAAGLTAAVTSAGWPGVVLPFTRLLGIGCYPVVQFTGPAPGWRPRKARS